MEAGLLLDFVEEGGEGDCLGFVEAFGGELSSLVGEAWGTGEDDVVDVLLGYERDLALGGSLELDIGAVGAYDADESVGGGAERGSPLGC